MPTCKCSGHAPVSLLPDAAKLHMSLLSLYLPRNTKEYQFFTLPRNFFEPETIRGVPSSYPENLEAIVTHSQVISEQIQANKQTDIHTKRIFVLEDVINDVILKL